jgi:predicted nucleotide-binding protein
MLRLDSVLRPGATTVLSGYDAEVAIEGYMAEQINHHLTLLIQMGYVDPAGSQPAIGVALKGIAPAGYDFLDRNRIALEETTNQPVTAQLSRKIFIVRGHEGGPREGVARFLQQLGFEPIILHEQDNEGRTVIEKFEAHADVNFAVVLLTPDDVGGPRDGPQQPRARQNVVLELGYFIGKLGRGKVCAIKSGELEIPSDILGVVWTPYDAHGAWKRALAKELQAAGFEIDRNKVMRA